MTINGRGAPGPSLRWALWWRWTLISLIGIIVASMLHRMLPHDLINPPEDENIWLAQPWRVALLNSVSYIPISLAQWLVLRRYVWRAWWWLVATIGSVVVAYPASIWVFGGLGRIFSRGGLELPAMLFLEFAWAIWFLGLGGITVYLVAQWIALLRWTRNTRIWGIWLAATLLGWLLVLIVNALFSSDLASGLTRDTALINQLLSIAVWGLYQLNVGAVLAIVVRTNLQSEEFQTTRG